MMLRLEYHDAFQPYTRMTRRGKYVDEAAQRYLDSQMRLALSFKAQLARDGLEMLPPRTPLSLSLVIVRRSRLHTRDLSNELKAVEDALQHVAFQNDCWVDDIHARRVLGAEDYMSVAVGCLTR